MLWHCRRFQHLSTQWESLMSTVSFGLGVWVITRFWTERLGDGWFQHGCMDPLTNNARSVTNWSLSHARAGTHRHTKQMVHGKCETLYVGHEDVVSIVLINQRAHHQTWVQIVLIFFQMLQLYSIELAWCNGTNVIVSKVKTLPIWHYVQAQTQIERNQILFEPRSVHRIKCLPDIFKPGLSPYKETIPYTTDAIRWRQTKSEPWETSMLLHVIRMRNPSALVWVSQYRPQQMLLSPILALLVTQADCPEFNTGHQTIHSICHSKYVKEMEVAGSMRFLPSIK